VPEEGGQGPPSDAVLHEAADEPSKEVLTASLSPRVAFVWLHFSTHNAHPPNKFDCSHARDFTLSNCREQERERLRAHILSRSLSLSPSLNQKLYTPNPEPSTPKPTPDSRRHRVRRLQGTNSASPGLSDFPQAGMLGLRYNFVNLGPEKSPGSLFDRHRYPVPSTYVLRHARCQYFPRLTDSSLRILSRKGI
jgi:hypothetical protein